MSKPCEDPVQFELKFQIVRKMHELGRTFLHQCSVEKRQGYPDRDHLNFVLDFPVIPKMDSTRIDFLIHQVMVVKQYAHWLTHYAEKTPKQHIAHLQQKMDQELENKTFEVHSKSRPN